MNRFARNSLIAGLSLGLLLLSGCKEEDYRLVFSHNLHVEENGMDCDECHGGFSPEGFTRVSHATCADCHEEVESEDISKKTCGICHVQKTREEFDQLAREPRSGPRGVFVHTEALAGQCADCHGGILNEDLTSVPKLDRQDVLAIRNRSHAREQDCSQCHVDMDMDTPPQNHELDWQQRHGFFASQEDAACSVCHTENSCQECHSVTQPRSHNNLWRRKTHGVEAMWGRESCTLCHEPESCDSCHQEVKPMSHTAAWKDTHCVNCHTSPSSGEGCVVCHQDGVIDSHPNPHPAGFRSRHCDNCHPGTPQAESCAICHEGGFDAHPNPHSAGWRSRHCDNCHEDSPQRDKCNYCHETTVANHPDPHSGGWRDRHCVTCHQGSAQNNDCSRCHEGGGNVLVHEDSWPDYHNRFGTAAMCFDCHIL